MAFIGNTNTTQAFTPAIDYFSGNGSTTAFTLSRPVASVAQVQVTIDNVAQNPSSAFTVSANTITFTSAPLSGTNNIYVYYTSPITQVIAPSQGTVQTAQLGNITNIASGNSSLTLQTGSSPTTAVTVNTSQNVGIGTVSPATLLHLSSATPPNIRLQSDTTSSAMGVDFYYTSASGSKGGLTANFGAGEVRLSAGASGNTYFQSFYTNNTERMRIDSSGNVLVGATTPYSGTVSNVTATTGVDIGSSSTATSKQLQFIRNGSTGTAGNIYATAGSFSNYCGIEFVIENVGGGSQSGYLKFNTTSSATSAERARINSSGQLVMATSTYGIVGQIQAGITADTSGMNSLVSVAGDQNGGYPFGARGNSTNQGLFGFFNSSNSTIGSITKSGSNVAYNTSSDYRLKENIAPMTGALAKVAQLKPVTYTWKEDGSDGEGFIAHELAEVKPHAVAGEKDALEEDGRIKPQGIDTSFLVATLTAAIQELKAINDTQAETINALTARIVALENR